MKQDLIDKYNPHKFRELKQEDIEAMRNFSMEDIADLAKAYPNKPTERAYLVLFDKTDKAKQLYPLGTWQNLYTLWKTQNLTKFVPWNFAALHNTKAISGPVAKKTGPVQDLTEAEVKKELKQVPKPTVKPSVKRVPLVQEPKEDVRAKFDLDDDGSDTDFTEENFEEQLEQIKKTTPKKATPKKTVKKVDKATAK